MALFNDNIRMGSSAAGAYEIERSLRFNSSDSPYLTWTPSSSGNQQVMTWSFWYKRSSPGGSAEYVITAFNGTNTDRIAFQNDDQLHIELKDGNATEGELHSKRLFRDPSAWYHIVVAFDTTDGSAANRCKAYVNNEQITDWDTENTISQNYSCSGFNTASKVQDIGAYSGSGGSRSGHCDGYITELHFIDGQQLTPSSFGETDDDTGQWIPKKYAGTYGNEGYYLNFSDNSNTTATTLGKDSSGNGNNWTPNNLSVAAGAGNDSLEDTPTNNFCTANPLDKGSVDIENGALTVSRTSDTADWELCGGTIGIPNSGKWYWEGTVNGNMDGVILGVGQRIGSSGNDTNLDGENDPGHYYYNTAGYAGYNGSYSSDPAAVTAGQVVQIAFDRDNNKIWFGVNGTWGLYGGTPVTPTDPNSNHTSIPADVLPVFGCRDTGQVDLNFGQRSFEFTKPTGYNSLCTANLPTPTIKKGTDHFGTLLYTGSESAQVVNGLDFTPDLIVNTSRSAASHTLWIDRVRTFDGNKMLTSITYSEEGVEEGNVYGHIDSYSGGFIHATGSDGSYPWAQMNSSGSTFVNWCWLADGTSGSSNDDGDITSTVSVNSSAGFSIVTYTGTGSNTDTVGHGLGVVPDWIIIKRRTNSGSGVTGSNWRTHHSSMAAGTSLELNGTGSSQNQNGVFDDGTTTTSSVFRPNDHLSVNASGDTYVAWCWTSVEGYSKMGTYSGNNNTNGPFVYTGFKPAFVITKAHDRSAHWYVWDNERTPYNQVQKVSWWNMNGAEEDHAAYGIDFLSNGFKVRNDQSDTNTSGSQSIYMAFAERPFKYANAR